ncbi:MAG: hypothetical protein GDA42_00115 [Ekhidna sp.]|nr:hypothetical protein [Ekhidna sp.]MBC6408864.1 hypothetical protein [Ekhidna sp.]
MKDTTKKTFELADKDFFDLMARVQNQYEEYIKLSALDLQKEESQLNLIKRDINHPLGIVIR